VVDSSNKVGGEGSREEVDMVAVAEAVGGEGEGDGNTITSLRDILEDLWSKYLRR
jgi:hypothetical protein